MVFGWFKENKSKEEIELESRLFREEERNKIWNALLTENPPYKAIQFEPLAYLEPNKHKALFTFDKSCERLPAGYRHPLPNEVFSLIIDGLEGRLSEELLAVKEDFFKSYGEWLDIVLKPENGMLHCYEQPRKVIHIPDDYDCSKMIFAREKQFPLNGLPLKTYVSIKDVASKSPLLVTYLWSRPFKNLPSEIQNNAGLWIPDHARPVGRGGYDYYYVVAYGYGRASRGVVDGKKIYSRGD